MIHLLTASFIARTIIVCYHVQDVIRPCCVITWWKGKEEVSEGKSHLPLNNEHTLAVITPLWLDHFLKVLPPNSVKMTINFNTRFERDKHLNYSTAHNMCSTNGSRCTIMFSSLFFVFIDAACCIAAVVDQGTEVL